MYIDINQDFVHSGVDANHLYPSQSRVDATKFTDFPMLRLEDFHWEAEIDDDQGTWARYPILF